MDIYIYIFFLYPYVYMYIYIHIYTHIGVNRDDGLVGMYRDVMGFIRTYKDI